MKTEYNSVIVYNKVYNFWTEAFSEKWKQDSDPMRLLREYVQYSDDVGITYEQKFRFEIEFCTSIGKEVLSWLRVDEALVDPTFETNW